MENTILVCLYCADTMEKPSQTVLEKFGDNALNCCNHKMAEIDMNEAYKVIKVLDIVKERIETEMIKGL